MRPPARATPQQRVPEGMPPGTRIGRQAWIGTDADAPGVLRQAVVVGDLTDGARKGNALHCWGQEALFSSAGWRQATVCDATAATGASRTWFVAYGR